jgi:murein tripeptide amidase MpaA
VTIDRTHPLWEFTLTPNQSPWVATSSEYRPDRYYRYDQLTELLHRWANEHADVLTIESIGKSFEGRDIWALTLTDPATGGHDLKPAYLVEANIHAGEVTGEATVLWLLNYMLTNRASDPTVRRTIQETATYFVPVINVDGMDALLGGRPESVRSSMRPFPEREQQDGLVREDIDGDGVIRVMRLKDPTGPWKVSPHDDRLLEKRTPDETGGDYYYLLPEGRIQNWDGGKVMLAPDLYGLDANRNFPSDWKPHWHQSGAGEYPLSEPETRALADFMLAHPNIHGSQHFHTHSGVILRPPTQQSQTELSELDRNVLIAIGAMGTEETGYPCVSIFDDFAYDKKKPTTGNMMDFMYDNLGAIPFATELWSLPKKAGIEVKDFIAFFKDRDRSIDAALLKLVDEELGGEGFLAWTPFDHRQMGPVEIGGWDTRFTLQNPPGPWLEEVTAPNARFVLRAMQTAPRIELREVKAESLGGGTYRISAIVQNTGFLPTYVSQQALKTAFMKPVKAELGLPAGASIASGLNERDLGHLSGRANQYGFLSWGDVYPIDSRTIVEWIVVAPAGGSVTLTVRSTKAGTVSETVALGGAN